MSGDPSVPVPSPTPPGGPATTQHSSPSNGNNLHPSLRNLCRDTCPVLNALERSPTCSPRLLQGPNGPEVVVEYAVNPKEVYLQAQVSELQASNASKEAYIEALLAELACWRSSQNALPVGLDAQGTLICQFMMNQLRAHAPATPVAPTAPAVLTPAAPSAHRSMPAVASGTRGLPQQVAQPVSQEVSSAQPVRRTYASRAAANMPATSRPVPATFSAPISEQTRALPTRAENENAVESSDEEPWQTSLSRRQKHLRKQGVDVTNAALVAKINRLSGGGRNTANDGVAERIYITNLLNPMPAWKLKEEYNNSGNIHLAADRVFAISRIQHGAKGRSSSYTYELFVKASKKEAIVNTLTKTLNLTYMPSFDPTLPPPHERDNEDAKTKAKEKTLERYARLYNLQGTTGAVKQCIRNLVIEKGWDDIFDMTVEAKIRLARQARAARQRAADTRPMDVDAPSPQQPAPAQNATMEVVQLSRARHARADSAPPSTIEQTLVEEGRQQRHSSVQPSTAAPRASTGMIDRLPTVSWADEVESEEEEANKRQRMSKVGDSDTSDEENKGTSHGDVDMADDENASEAEVDQSMEIMSNVSEDTRAQTDYGE